MWKNYFLALFCLSMFACDTSTTTETAATGDKTSSEMASTKTDDKQFGETFDAGGSITYDDLLTKLVGADSIETKVTGTVNAVCQTKGCWMTIASENGGPNMRVRFKDYGFFMPKDIAGKKVVFSGKAFREITSVDELRHYAEDAGKSKVEIAAITEPEEDMKFLASGVILLDE